MEFEITGGTCVNKCVDEEKCNKYCTIHAGKALYNMLKSVDLIETRIGEYSSSKTGGKPDLIVSGHQIWDLGSPSWLLTSIDTILDARPKFSGVFDKSPSQLISLYCRQANISTEDTYLMTEAITKLAKNRFLALPFKPHTPCNADIEYDGVKEIKRDGEIAYIAWRTDKELHKLTCTVGIKLKTAIGESVVKFPLSDYIDKFRLSALDMQIRGGDWDKQLLEITDTGLFKPIVINDKGATIALDGTYLYSTVNGITHIEGYWNEKDELVMTSAIKNKAIKKIKDNLQYIKSHKKYLAPYLLFESNVIDL